MVLRRAAPCRMGQVAVGFDGLLAGSVQGGGRADAGDLGDEGTGAQLAGRLHPGLIAWRARRASLPRALLAWEGPRPYDRHVLLAVLLAVQAAASPAAPPAATPPPAPARPTDWPFRLFSPDDYPAAALRTRAEGRVVYRLEIRPDGRVGRCDVRISSGSAALDQSTCRIVRARARFPVARDGEGNPVPDSREGEVVWRLEGEERE